MLREAPLESRAKVVTLCFELLDDLECAWTAKLWFGTLGKIDKEVEVAIVRRLDPGRVGQAIERELADRLEQSIPGVAGVIVHEYERLVDQLRQHIQHRVALDAVATNDFLRGLERP